MVANNKTVAAALLTKAKRAQDAVYVALASSLSEPVQPDAYPPKFGQPPRKVFGINSDSKTITSYNLTHVSDQSIAGYSTPGLAYQALIYELNRKHMELITALQSEAQKWQTPAPRDNHIEYVKNSGQSLNRRM